MRKIVETDEEDEDEDCDERQMNFEQSAGPSGFNLLLECSEQLFDSPSTSQTADIVKPNVAFPPRRFINNSHVDRVLNSNLRTSVYNQIDVHIQLDPRSLMNLMEQEEYFQSNYHYFTAVQEHITAFHREQACEWIYDVAKEERCDGDVYLQAVAIIDRFLSYHSIFKHDIQMVAGVALFIASKLKATHPISVRKIAYYSDGSCKLEDILEWELLMVQTLEWETESPTAFDFFDQLVARLPQINQLRKEFQEVVQRCQKMHKLATILPSVQCSIALWYVACSLPDVVFAGHVKNLILHMFQLQVNLLDSYMPMVQRCLIPGNIYEQPHPEAAYQQHAPPSSSDNVTPPQELQQQQVVAVPMVPQVQMVLQQVSASEMTPSTPLNDSGFCSDVSSPESSEKKRKFRRSDSLDDDVTPPKMLRIH